MASLLASLPIYIGSNIVSHWLRADSLSKLDAAHCNHAERSRVLYLLNHSTVLEVDHRFHGPHISQRIKWMVDRGVKCPSMWYDAEDAVLNPHDEPIWDSFIRSNATTLSILHLCTGSAAIKIWLRLLVESKCSLSVFTIRSMPLQLEKKDITALQKVLTNSSQTLCEFRIHTRRRVVMTGILGSSDFPILAIADFPYVLDADVISLCMAAANLKRLTLKHDSCTRIGLAAIGQYCHELEHLAIISPFGSDVLDYEDIIEKAAPAIGTGCPNLKSIAFDQCQDLTDAGLTTLVTRCTQLEELRITDNHSVTDDPLIALAHSTTSMRSLTLHECSDINGAGVVAIATHSPLLHTLQLHTALSMDYIREAIPHMGSVKVLHLCKSYDIDDKLIHLIADLMPLLEEFNIDSKYQQTCTAEALGQLLMKCEKLVLLDVGKSVTESQVLLWEQMRPGLVVNKRK